MGEPRSVRVVRNGKSGSGSASADEIRETFTQHGCTCAMTELSPGLDLRALARSDAREVIWVAAGGDGTVNAVASQIARTDRVMGVLPAGTLNHFARDLHLPADIPDAIGVIATSGWRRIDAAEANGRWFVNCSSLGLYPEIVLERDRMIRGRRWAKWGAMVVASTRAFLRFRRLEVEVELNGTLRSLKTPLLFVGNNAYEMDGQKAGQRRRLDEGKLTVVVAPGLTRWGALRLLLAALVGRAGSLPELERYELTGFTVRSRKRRMRVALDGEVRRMVPPICYRSVPGALCVIAPPETSA